MYYLLLNAAPQGDQPNPIVGFLPFIIMIGIIYFLLIRPQQKKQKDHARMVESVKVHDNVIMSCGIIGKVVNIKTDKNIVVVRVDEANNTKIEFQKNHVSGVLTEKQPEKIE